MNLKEGVVSDMVGAVFPWEREGVVSGQGFPGLFPIRLQGHAAQSASEPTRARQLSRSGGLISPRNSNQTPPRGPSVRSKARCRRCSGRSAIHSPHHGDPFAEGGGAEQAVVHVDQAGADAVAQPGAVQGEVEFVAGPVRGIRSPHAVEGGRRADRRAVAGFAQCGRLLARVGVRRGGVAGRSRGSARKRGREVARGRARVRGCRRPHRFFPVSR